MKRRRQRTYQHRRMCRECNSRASPLSPEYSGKAHLYNMEIIRGTRSNRAPKDNKTKTANQKEYNRPHDWMGKTVHWDICRKKGFNVPEKWYKHKPLSCTENESFKILWTFNIQTDNIIERRRPDMIIIDKTSKKAQIVDFAVPADHQIEISHQRKIESYRDLKRELQKLWSLKISIVPIVIGALGTIPKSLEKHLNELNVEVNISQWQTTVLLNSGRIVRKVLEFYGVLLTLEL